MTAQLRISTGTDVEPYFAFSGQPRQFPPVTAVPFRWPTKSEAANEYISSWRELAGQVLAQFRLSKSTMACIASHTSRRDGACRLTDGALSNRSGRKLRSTKRDIQRLKQLGLLVTEYENGDHRQERIRVLKLAIPSAFRSGQRIPHQNALEVGPTYPPYVGTLDMGGRRNV